MAQKYDVIVVGGGPAGLSLSIMLADRGVRVACLDRDAPLRQMRPGFDGRTTALAAAAKDALDHAGVWRALAAKACPIRDIIVTDSGAPRALHFDHRAVGDAFGWIVENRHLRRALHDRLASLPAARLIAEAEVRDIETTPHGVMVTAKTPKGVMKIQGALLIGADGRRSFCRTWAGIGWNGQDYWQSAVVCTIKHGKPHGHVAIEDFLPGGPLAALPMQGGRSSIVWTHRHAAAALLRGMNGKEFCTRLEKHLAPRFGAIALDGPRFLYPLGVYHAARYTAPRLALAGEAAHVMHPIAGQGFNLSMRDNACLASLVADALELGLDCGGQDVLARYERARRADNLLMLAATDGLDRLFSNSLPGLGLVRQSGLEVVARMPRLKTFFMQAAMGRLTVAV